MIQFLDTKETLREAKRLLGSCEEAVLAVAFWGEGAVQQLGLTQAHAGKVAIFCDPESGACNPYELDRILELGLDVRAKRRLHAKVLWTPTAVIIGSSNISANGLGFEGSDLTTNIEANIITDDEKVISIVRKWLNDPVMPGGEYKDDLKMRCKNVWKLRRNTRDRLVVGEPVSETLWERVVRDPGYFRNKRIFIWMYSDVLTRSEEAALTGKRAESGDNNLFAYSLDRKGDATPGDFIVDFYFEKVKLICKGLWEIVDLPFLTIHKSLLAFCRQHNSFEGMKLSGGVRDFSKYLYKYMRENRLSLEKSLYHVGLELAEEA